MNGRQTVALVFGVALLALGAFAVLKPLTAELGISTYECGSAYIQSNLLDAQCLAVQDTTRVLSLVLGGLCLLASVVGPSAGRTRES
jgi:hypothetical protein